ncbi:MAG: hypothetical protein ACTSRK_19450 [Promethearchaeota archaeon]
MSQSELEIIFTFLGTDVVLKGNLLRMYSPMTIQKLFDKTYETGSFTCRSRGNLGLPKAYWMFLVELRRGAEKKEYKNFKVGDIVYCPRQDAVYVIYDIPNMALPVYYLGEITVGLEHLSTMRNGTMVKIEINE